MTKQLYTAVFSHTGGWIYWGSRDERVVSLTLHNVKNCKGNILFEINKTRLTRAWPSSLKKGDIVQFNAERYGNRLMSVSGVKVVGHI